MNEIRWGAIAKDAGCLPDGPGSQPMPVARRQVAGAVTHTRSDAVGPNLGQASVEARKLQPRAWMSCHSDRATARTYRSVCAAPITDEELRQTGH